ncbi:MAG: phenylacetate--CoA ligase family protein [Massilia sp.]|nr:phenylacetate--CoA ligase family protein [Massilia sp.]
MGIALRYRLIDLARGTRAIAMLSNLRRRQFDNDAILATSGRAALDTYFDALRRAVPRFRDVARFEDLPVIDKHFVNTHRDELVNPEYRGKKVRKKTGGSTGEPLVYYTSTETQSYLWAGLFLAWEAAGYRLGDKVASLAGSSLYATGYKQRLYYKLLKVTLMSAFDMSTERMEDYAAQLRDGGFRLLYGYASAIHRLARHMLDQKRTLKTSLRGIVCTAEMLTPSMRADIEAAFGVPCFSQYGCHEAGVSAFECEQRQGFHLLSQRAHVEVMPDGRLISTDLSNDAMFLPRYNTGDMVRMSGRSCPCGRGLPLIDEVIGRQNDIVVDPRGAAVHSEFFTHLFREDGRIQAFQVVFDERSLVVNVRLSPRPAEELAALAKPYRERIAKSLHFDKLDFVFNQPFEKLANSKHRFVIRRSSAATHDPSATSEAATT